MTEILVLSASEVKRLVSMRDIVDAVEEAFRAYGKGDAKLAPVVLTMVNRHQGEHEIKSGYVEGYSIGTKVVTFYSHNRERYGLPALSGIIVLNDLDDGRPLAVLDGAYITASRTGAAGAVAAKYLARKDSRKVGVIGAGTQGRYQVAALTEVLSIDSVKVYDAVPRSAEKYVEEMQGQYRLEVQKAESPMQALQGADIIITATPSTQPIVHDAWVREGVHISAIGADSPGKQELDPEIVARSKVVVDSAAQCIERGEIQTAIRLGLLKREQIYAELSEIVLGRKSGRIDTREITLFDATGIAVQDITTAYTVYQLAKKEKMGVTINMG
jgi:alanine dehydrogenase